MGGSYSTHGRDVGELPFFKYIFALKKTHVYWTQNICEPDLRHSKWRREDGKDKGWARPLMRYRFPPSPYLGWLTTNVCICNGQRSSEISCDKYAYNVLKLFSLAILFIHSLTSKIIQKLAQEVLKI
jgi:hypothetical protein